MRRILVTGSRDWTNRETIRRALIKAVGSSVPWNVTVIVGCAPGADTIAEEEAIKLGMHIERHPADWKNHGRRLAGLIRNSEMVESGADICIAFSLGKSSGTRDCMRKAGRADIPIDAYGDK